MIKIKKIWFLVFILTFSLYLQPIKADEVATLSATSITSDSATLKAEIKSVTTHNSRLFFEYWEENTNNRKVAIVKEKVRSEGIFTKKITNLEPDKTYIYRAVILGEDWGTRKTFTTRAESPINFDEIKNIEILSWSKPIPYYGMNLTGWNLFVSIVGLVVILVVLAYLKFLIGFIF